MGRSAPMQRLSCESHLSSRSSGQEILDRHSVDVFLLWMVHQLSASASGEARCALLHSLVQMGRSCDPHTCVLYFCMSGKAELYCWFCQEIT